ncbi:MAG: twin-arginine translocation signal domain-containing protein [Acidobacteriia bacterium]|nr:twin-arginine translocation signal domain-containing protein [Terriglobia bacterium]
MDHESDRRDFIRGLAAAIGAAGVSLNWAECADAVQGPGAAPKPQKAPAGNLVGIQMGPHTMLDEGIDRCLDLIQETAAINTLFVYSHAYGGDLRKPLSYLATDHGVPPHDQRARTLPLVWVKQHDQFFEDTTLRHQKVDATFDYYDRDLFAELVAPVRKRGMKLYARILESGSRAVQNVSKVATVNVAGRPTQTGCWNHPEYKAFWNAPVEDLFRSYNLDGFQWGAERASPLTNLIQNGNENSASCFCEFCRARGKAQGIDAERARKGYADVLAFVQGLRAGKPRPADGTAAGFLRILLRYPEVLAWEYQYRLSREEVMKGMYDTIKNIKPSAPVGWHVDHWATSMDMIARAAMSYAEMAPHSDYLKVVVYHAVTGPRTRSWVANDQRSVLSDLTLQEALDLHYELFGYDKKIEANATDAVAKPGSPDYVYRETKRSVASAEGKTKIYPGIGFNVPGGPPEGPETVYEAVTKAYEAGADGIVASREYEEMTVPNLRAVGRAVRALN